MEPGSCSDGAAAEHDSCLSGAEAVPRDKPQQFLVFLVKMPKGSPNCLRVDYGNLSRSERVLSRGQARNEDFAARVTPALVSPQVAGDRKQPGQRVIAWNVVDSAPSDLECASDEVVSIGTSKPAVEGVTTQRRVRGLKQRAKDRLSFHHLSSCHELPKCCRPSNASRPMFS